MGEPEKKDNSGICVKEDADDGENDWHGVLKEILEFKYVGEPMQRVVIFYVNCTIQDILTEHVNGTCKHNNYKIIEINHTKGYVAYGTFKMQDKCIIYHILESENRSGGW